MVNQYYVNTDDLWLRNCLSPGKMRSRRKSAFNIIIKNEFNMCNYMQMNTIQMISILNNWIFIVEQ